MIVRLENFNLALTADSGQSFRFAKQDNGVFRVIAYGKALCISDLGGGRYDFSCSREEFDALWSNYFDLDRDYAALNCLVGEDAGYLRRALEYASGVRILRQEPFEALVCFIISQRKSIPAIRTCVEALCARFGEALQDNNYAFPTPGALATASEADLLACGLGYRVPYVRQTARRVQEGGTLLEDLTCLDDEALGHALRQFPGVGRKVAACVMLFAYQRMDAFPVDVWIQKVLDAEYPQGFPHSRYPGVSGILQQYLFCYARHCANRGTARNL